MVAEQYGLYFDIRCQADQTVKMRISIPPNMPQYESSKGVEQIIIAFRRRMMATTQCKNVRCISLTAGNVHMYELSTELCVHAKT